MRRARPRCSAKPRPRRDNGIYRQSPREVAVLDCGGIESARSKPCDNVRVIRHRNAAIPKCLNFGSRKTLRRRYGLRSRSRTTLRRLTPRVPFERVLALAKIDLGETLSNRSPCLAMRACFACNLNRRERDRVAFGVTNKATPPLVVRPNPDRSTPIVSSALRRTARWAWRNSTARHFEAQRRRDFGNTGDANVVDPTRFAPAATHFRPRLQNRNRASCVLSQTRCAPETRALRFRRRSSWRAPSCRLAMRAPPEQREGSCP